MYTRQALASGLMVTFLTASMSVGLGAQTASINGTAKNEVKMPYSDFTVQVRNVMTGTIAGTSTLDANAKWTFTSLPPANYVVELVRVSNNKVICAEGPFNLAQQKLTK